MKKVDERIYLLTDLDGNEVCRLVIEQLASFGPPDHFANGRVVVTFLYGKNSNRFSENWGIDPLSNSPTLRVRDFILPLDLRFKTVGTVCWSLIYRTLPLQVRDSIQLSGLLSSADARIPKRNLQLARWRTWENIRYHRGQHRSAQQVLVEDVASDNGYPGLQYEWQRALLGSVR